LKKIFIDFFTSRFKLNNKFINEIETKKNGGVKNKCDSVPHTSPKTEAEKNQDLTSRK
jgi:hypothetical protein